MTNSTLAKIAITAAVAVAGVGFLVMSSRENSQAHEKVDELLATDPGQWDGRELKVYGFVEAGSIVEKTVDQETRRTFILQNAGRKVRVFSSGPKPDTFKDQSEVAATGHLVPAAQLKTVADALGVHMAADQTYVVDATELMAKCPSKYEGAQGNRQIDEKKFN
jgi:cytochrome c-type biogenesis protein CcmE